MLEGPVPGEDGDPHLVGGQALGPDPRADPVLLPREDLDLLVDPAVAVRVGAAHVLKPQGCLSVLHDRRVDERTLPRVVLEAVARGGVAAVVLEGAVPEGNRRFGDEDAAARDEGAVDDRHPRGEVHVVREHRARVAEGHDRDGERHPELARELPELAGVGLPPRRVVELPPEAGLVVGEEDAVVARGPRAAEQGLGLDEVLRDVEVRREVEPALLELRLARGGAARRREDGEEDGGGDSGSHGRECTG